MTAAAAATPHEEPDDDAIDHEAYAFGHELPHLLRRFGGKSEFLTCRQNDPPFKRAAYNHLTDANLDIHEIREAALRLVQRSLGTAPDGDGDDDEEEDIAQDERFERMAFSDASFDNEAEPMEWLVDEILPCDGVVALVGKSKKAKKTWFATELARAIVTGTPACGVFKVRKGPAAYVYTEDFGGAVKSRIRALMVGAGLGSVIPARLHWLPRGGTINLLRDRDLADLLVRCLWLGKLAVLFLDPLRNLHRGNEISAEDMSNVFERLKLLGTWLRCAIVVMHHEAEAKAKNRSGGDRIRGNSAIHGAIDAGLYLSRVGGDDRSHFELSLESEIKGAQSGGTRRIDLDIDDNENHEAICARWTIDAESKTKVKAKRPPASGDARDIDRVVAFVAKLAAAGVHRGKSGLRNHPDKPTDLSEGRMRALLEQALAAGLLEQRGAKVHVVDTAVAA